MPYISKDFIQNKLMPSLDIVKVLNQYLSLKKQGANYTCCCPFHNEKTPSFSVNPSKQYFYCFGCHESGTVIDFVMKYKNETFPEAVEELARFAGVEVEYDRETKGQKEKFDRHKMYFELLDRAAAFFTKSLYENQAALEYFTKTRQLTTETIKYARLGYAPNDFNYVQTHIAKTDEEARILCELGLLKENSSPDSKFKYRSFFKDRVMFPIFDVKGRIIGFGGRLMSGDGPKYLNSPESEFFKKRQELFGLYECLQATRNRPESIVIVEGYMDVIALRQAGFKNVVATLGTASNSEHFKILFKHTSTVICCYDGDRAGQMASWKALQAAAAVLPDDRTIRFATLPPGHDPDSLIRAADNSAFQQVLDKSLGLSEAIILHFRAKYDLTDVENITLFIREVLSVAKALTPLRCSSLLLLLNSIVTIPVEQLNTLLAEVAPDPEFKEFEARSQSNDASRSGGGYVNPNWGQNGGGTAPRYQTDGHAYRNNRSLGYQDNGNQGAAARNYSSGYGERRSNYGERHSNYSERNSNYGERNVGGNRVYATNSGRPAGGAYYQNKTGAAGARYKERNYRNFNKDMLEPAIADYDSRDLPYDEMSEFEYPLTPNVVELGGFIPNLLQGMPGVNAGQLIVVDPRARVPKSIGNFKSMEHLLNLSDDERLTYCTLVGKRFNQEALNGSVHKLLAFILQEPSVVLHSYEMFQFEFFQALCQAFRMPEYPCLARILFLIKYVKDVSSAAIIETFRDTEFASLIVGLSRTHVCGKHQTNLDDLSTKELMLLLRSLMLKVLYDLLEQRLLQLNSDKMMPRYKSLEANMINNIMVFMFNNLRLDQPVAMELRNKFTDKISSSINAVTDDQKVDYLKALNQAQSTQSAASSTPQKVEQEAAKPASQATAQVVAAQANAAQVAVQPEVQATPQTAATPTNGAAPA